MYERTSSRGAAPWLDPGYEAVDLASLTAERAEAFRDAIARAGMILVTDCPPLPAAFVDPGSWQTIVDTLVANAMVCGTAGRITVSLHLQGTRFVLSVSDMGAGLSFAELTRVFTRSNGFRRTQPRHRCPAGMDLALVQELAVLHGGEAAVTSIQGQGSCFTVSIPAGEAIPAAGQPPRVSGPVALTGD